MSSVQKRHPDASAQLSSEKSECSGGTGPNLGNPGWVYFLVVSLHTRVPPLQAPAPIFLHIPAFWGEIRTFSGDEAWGRQKGPERDREAVRFDNGGTSHHRWCVDNQDLQPLLVWTWWGESLARGRHGRGAALRELCSCLRGLGRESLKDPPRKNQSPLASTWNGRTSKLPWELKATE